MLLADFISPDAMVARSINLERDMGAVDGLLHYHLTSKALEILTRFAAALNGERICAWSLTGPYGMGKSSFANYLLALCGPRNAADTIQAWAMLEGKHPTLAGDLKRLLSKHCTPDNGLLRVAATASFEPLNRTLAHGLHRALVKSTQQAKQPAEELFRLLARTEELCAQTAPESSQVIALFKAAKRIYGAPIVLVIDEIGKNLEYMVRFPAQGDLFVLQLLAESREIFIWVCLHQAFAEYTTRLSSRQLQEWGKIQGRFEDISFVESKSEMIHLICEALARKNNDPPLVNAVDHWANYYYGLAKQLQLAELKGLDKTTVERFYPLHPLAAVILPELCTRFAQNDRTLFAFLCSGEPKALPAFLASQSIDPVDGVMPTFGLELLYDYFLASSGTALLHRPESHRWIEINDVIERSRHIEAFHLALLKVIGLMNLIAGPARFRCSQDLLTFAMARPDVDPAHHMQQMQRIMADNIDKGVLIYREYADEYRLWEGTDFDIPAAVRERKGLLATQPLDVVLKETLPLSPLIASKHSYQTGTLRHLERRWASFDGAAEDVANWDSVDSDGLVLYCFGKEQGPPELPPTAADGRPIVLCYAACEDQIRELILDAAASRAVLRESPELVHDGVARKEAKYRAQIADERLRAYLQSLFVPGNPEVVWRALDATWSLTNQRDLSRLLSKCCDAAFAQCPVLKNELINRNRLSSAAARARRELMQAMVLNEGQEMLGLVGTGPEVAIYRTILLAEKLHQEGNDGSWHFAAPTPHSHYHPLWQALTEVLEEAGDDSVPIINLIQLLRHPPFGLKDGPIPILLCLFLLVKADEIALYQEKSYVPVLGPEEMELLAKRPEYFAVRKFRQERLRGQVFQLYMALLKTETNKDETKLRNATLLSVVGPLVQFVRSLRPYVLHTNAVSRYARNVRQALQQARDPFDLLYKDLPQALDLQPFENQTQIQQEHLSVFEERFSKAIIELRQAFPKLLQQITQIMLQTFGGKELAALRTELKERAARLLTRCSDPELKPLLAAMDRFVGANQDWLIAIATIASQRPVDTWREADLQNFAARIRDCAERMKALETLIARTEQLLPGARDDRIPHLLTVTKIDGQTSSNIFWIDETRVKKARQIVDILLQEALVDQATLETFFALLSERLLANQSSDNEEQEHG